MPFRLVTIATFRTPACAWLARNYLAEQSIQSFVIDENIPLAIWTWGNAVGWTKLQVKTEQAEAAREALKHAIESRIALAEIMADLLASRAPVIQGSPPFMDRTPIHSAEVIFGKMNRREDLACRARLAATFALLLVGNPIGVPPSADWVVTFYTEIAGFIMQGYATRLLYRVAAANEPMRQKYQADVSWGRTINAAVYALFTIILVCVLARSLR